MACEEDRSSDSPAAAQGSLGVGQERALLTDLYEMTMAASYFAEGMNYPATFELFSRQLPPRRNFLIACGLDPALEYLGTLRFSSEDLDYLRGLGIFDEDFLDFLGELRFSGEVWAIPEGEALFPPEPVLRVTAPLIEAQIVETYLLNCIDFHTLIASKAARVALASAGRPFVDFSARRTHGGDAAIHAARASFVGGAAATSNLLAGKKFGIPVSGTMAHSYVMTFPDEAVAFKAFARKFPERTTLLIDTFDVIEGARKAAAVADELVAEGIQVSAVRIDSGDLAMLAPAVRRTLDESGHPEIQIFVSGDLDEDRIAALMSEGAPIDGFGVGTQLGTGGDAPALGGAYKLVHDAHGPKLKLSEGKATMPGVKQVFRFVEEGRYARDLIALAEEPPPKGADPLLERVMDGGQRIGPAPTLEELRERCRSSLKALPEHLRSLDQSKPYEVSISPALDALMAQYRGRSSTPRAVGTAMPAGGSDA